MGKQAQVHNELGGDGITRGFGSINRSANGFKARSVKRLDSHVVLLGNSADVTTMTSMMVTSTGFQNRTSGSGSYFISQSNYW